MKIYVEQMKAILTQLGIAIPEVLSMNQKQTERLIASIETALDTYDPLPTGDAAVTDVRAGKTFSNATGLGRVGTLVDNEDAGVEITDVDGSLIPAGIYDGTGIAAISAADQALVVTGNIKAGVTILGVAGKTEVVDTTEATLPAAAANIDAGYFAWVNGVRIEGTRV